MVKVRQDAWSHEDDLLLAETVLRHIREGSTQLNAFDEVGDQLNRTSAACGFRWNAEVRMKYDHAIDLAKRQRKEKKRAMVSTINTRKPVITLPAMDNTQENGNESALVIEEEEPAITMDTVIRYLKEVKKDYHASNQSKESFALVQSENESLKEQITNLEKLLKQTEAQLTTIQNDYQSFIQIMERARKMTVLDDKGSIAAPTFRMDKNGNLEHFAHGSN
jgi:prespore-specific regulator